jgi:hypothetical protein
MALPASVTVLLIASGLASCQSHPTTVSATAPSTTTTEKHSSSSEASTTPSLPLSPEGATRSGTGTDVSLEAAGPDVLDRTTASEALLAQVETLPVRAEAPRSGYERSLFKHWDDEDHDGCDTRCEVLTAQRRADGTWLSEWDGYVTTNPAELQIDHVVALAEAWDSGANTWSAAQRDQFADDPSNLLAVTAAENLRKGDKDAAEWFPSRAEADCLWASTTVRVKSQWSLSVDQAEHDALVNLLHTCPDFIAPTTTTLPVPPPTTVLAPPVTEPPPPPPPTTTAPEPDCTPGYDPCIPPGPDVDCAGGSGNGPRYVEGPIYVTGDDPYGLDSNHDGIACAS